MSSADGPDRGRRWIPGLDSLRALAVALVVGYHLRVPLLGGGYLGVTVFFVISGYLVTRLLLEEAQDAGTVSLLGFWRRRVRRLVPAAAVTVVACLLWAVLVSPRQLRLLRGDAIASAVYSSNWWQVFRHVSYFDSFGLPSPLTHFWSLAIEEQFYLVWPLLLTALLATARKRVLVVALVVLIAASTVLMAWHATTSVNRAYLGTDTRAAELLVGALLAVGLHLAPVGQVPDSRPLLERRWPALGVPVAAAVLTVLVVTTNPSSALLFRGGFLVAALASAVLIAGLQTPTLRSTGARLDHGLPGWLGRRSYSVYLWHFPILVFVSRPTDFHQFSMARAVVVVLLTTAAAEASYRWIEQPVRRNGLRSSVRSVLRQTARLPRMPRLGVLTAGATAAVLCVAALAGFRGPAPDKHQPVAIQVGQAPQPVSQSSPAPALSTPTPSATPISPSPSTTQPPARPPARPTAATGRHLPAMSARSTLVVGDSITIDIAALLRARFPGITINAQVGRQPSTGLGIAARYAQFNRRGGTYVLGLGTNGAIDSADLVRFCRAHVSARILLITPQVDRSWEGGNLAAITAAARACANVRVVPFAGASRGHADYFGDDGVHLTPSGIRALVGLIQTAGRA